MGIGEGRIKCKCGASANAQQRTGWVWDWKTGWRCPKHVKKPIRNEEAERAAARINHPSVPK